MDELCSLKSGASSVEDFMKLEHLETALAVRAAYWVRTVVNKLTTTTAPKKVAMNDLYATDITRMSANHMLYLSFI